MKEIIRDIAIATKNRGLRTFTYRGMNFTIETMQGAYNRLAVMTEIKGEPMCVCHIFAW